MAELPTINLALYAQSDVGMVRSGNEDNFLILDLSTGRSWTAGDEEPPDLLTYSQGYYGSLLAVSDGMGGALAGEVASRMAVETVRDRMLQLQAHEIYGKLPFHERLRLSIEEANILINGESQTNPAHKGLGATFTAVATLGEKVFFGQVGDSRAYLVRGDRIERITKDQSLVQQLIDAGQITEEEAETHSYRNVILQALGAHGSVNVEVNSLQLCNLDTLVICSDGLSGKVSQDEIMRIVHESTDFKSACQQMIDLANSRGGEDNITVVIAQFSGAGLAATKDEAIEPQSLARAPDTPTEVNWEVGAATDPLPAPAGAKNAPTGPPDDFPTPPESRSTEPLPRPPAQSKPFTQKGQRSTTELSRSGELTERRGPITAVFAPEDFDEEAHVTTTSLKSSGAKTEPLESRGTKPINSQNATATLTQEPPPSKVGGSKTGAGKEKSNSSDGQGRRNLLIIVLLMALGVGGLVIGATTILKQRAEAIAAKDRDLMLKRLENQNQKDALIGGLRERIAEISKKLQASNKKSDKKSDERKRDALNENLVKLGQRLDKISDIPSEQQQQINQECDDIRKELGKIEEEVNNLQGLLPSSEINRDPVKV
jgi:PPM family protein phosphatase